MSAATVVGANLVSEFAVFPHYSNVRSPHGIGTGAEDRRYVAKAP